MKDESEIYQLEFPLSRYRRRTRPGAGNLDEDGILTCCVTAVSHLLIWILRTPCFCGLVDSKDCRFGSTDLGLAATTHGVD